MTVWLHDAPQTSALLRFGSAAFVQSVSGFPFAAGSRYLKRKSTSEPVAGFCETVAVTRDLCGVSMDNAPLGDVGLASGTQMGTVGGATDEGNPVTGLIVDTAANGGSWTLGTTSCIG